MTVMTRQERRVSAFRLPAPPDDVPNGLHDRAGIATVSARTDISAGCAAARTGIPAPAANTSRGPTSTPRPGRFLWLSSPAAPTAAAVRLQATTVAPGGRVPP
jgi:hypothetical protein